MRLKYQLFLILLLSGILMIALMAAIASWSFDRGFIGYINDSERQRLVPLIEALATGYVQEGDWHWITDERRAWGALLEEHLGFGHSSPASPVRDKRPDRRDELRSERKGEPGPRPDTRPGGDITKSTIAPPPRPPRNPETPLTLDPRLLLADAGQRVLIGRDDGNRRVKWQPITLEDRTVGYLGHRQRVALPSGLDQAFAVQQRRSFLYTALAMVLLSALLAIVLAGRLVRPLLSVNDAVARIGRGQYSFRVPQTRSDEIGDLSRSINTLAATLETNLDARRRWLAEISHELRTPVAVLQGELEAIQDGVNQLDAAAIASLHAETLRLARLIDDLHTLTLSDLGALDYHFERLDLRHMLTERVAAARTHPDAAQLSIQVMPISESLPIPLLVDGDTQRLEQLVDNLLQNSFRYTDAGGEIHVALSSVNGRAIIDWSDSAPGVDDEQLSLLFEPLYRTDTSRHRGNGGAGLGLAIVQRIIAAHSGTIEARHASLGGLTLRIELPLARENTA